MKLLFINKIKLYFMQLICLFCLIQLHISIMDRKFPLISYTAPTEDTCTSWFIKLYQCTFFKFKIFMSKKKHHWYTYSVYFSLIQKLARCFGHHHSCPSCFEQLKFFEIFLNGFLSVGSSCYASWYIFRLFNP